MTCVTGGGNICNRPRVERGVTGGETGVTGQE